MAVFNAPQPVQNGAGFFGPVSSFIFQPAATDFPA
jgi:hypothetical protein